MRKVFFSILRHSTLKERFQSFIVMREHVNLQELDNEGANVLFWCANPYYLDICLRYGVDMHTIAITDVYGESNAFEYKIKTWLVKTRNMAC